MEMVAAKDLRLADVVDLGGIDGFSTAIVKNVTDNEVTFFRPYGTTADFSYTGGVICYTGIEQFPVPRNDFTFKVLRRTNLK